MERANPFADLDLAKEFPPATRPAKPVQPAEIERLANDNGFPSRQRSAAVVANPATTRRRRHTTGRNQQLNLKVTAETLDRFYRMADAREMPLGELFELALAALERETTPPTR